MGTRQHLAASRAKYINEIIARYTRFISPGGPLREVSMNLREKIKRMLHPKKNIMRPASLKNATSSTARVLARHFYTLMRIPLNSNARSRNSSSRAEKDRCCSRLHSSLKIIRMKGSNRSYNVRILIIGLKIAISFGLVSIPRFCM